MQGNSGFTIESILLLIGIQKRTGELVIESGNSIGTIIFHNGSILQSFSPYARAIGDLLVEDGVLTEGELMDVLKFQKSDPDCPVGSLLMKAGKVSFEVIEMMVHEQIRLAVEAFRKWPNFSFNFIEREVKPYDSIHLPVYEFIESEALQSSADMLSQIVRAKKGSIPKAAPAK